ncbi:hypothetical protein BDZ89DRAFT_1076080 [Hymenopellis radicata]|nr:hypothetical protein BDZ89DRAFT_1076080 [Hymenopellis radicata]
MLESLAIQGSLILNLSSLFDGGQSICTSQKSIDPVGLRNYQTIDTMMKRCPSSIENCLVPPETFQHLMPKKLTRSLTHLCWRHCYAWMALAISCRYVH